MANIFLSKAQKRRYYRRLRLKLYCGTSLLVLLGVVMLYGLLNFSPLRVKKFEVSGSADMEALRGEVLKSGLAKFLGFSNFLSWPSEVSGLKVEKDLLSGTLRVITQSADRYVIWCGKDCFWIDRSGRLSEKAPDTEGSAIPKITDISGKALKIGGIVLQDAALVNFLKIMDGLSQLSLGVNDYRFDDRLQELRAQTIRGEKLIFSLRFAPSAKLFSYLKDVIDSGKLHTAEYIDFTVENRIYLKPR